MSELENSPFTHFEKLLENISQEIVVFDADGRFVYGNGASQRNGGLKNLTTGTVLSELYRDFEFRDVDGNIMEPKDYPSVKARQGIATQGNTFKFTNKKTGEQTWYETNATPLFDAQGKVSHVAISYQDITAKRSQQEKLKFLVDAFKVLTGPLDFNVLLRKISTLMVPTLADWSAIDILNKDGILKRIAVVHQDPQMIELVHEVDRLFPPDPDAPTGVYHVVKTGQAEFIPEINDAMIVESVKDPEALSLIRRLSFSSIMTLPITARGKVLGALTLIYSESGRHYTQNDLEFAADFCNHIGILLDNAKLYQEIENENQVKERFLATLSHELRNPLAPITNSIEMLSLKSKGSQDIKEEIEVINRQFKYMEKILKDLLEVSRLTSGTITLEKVPLDLGTVIKDGVESIRSVAIKTEHSVHAMIPDQPVMIMGDIVRITQVVINLIDNSIKFTPAGGTIWITLTSDGNTARLIIKDNGMGIRPRLLPHIFDLYTRRPRQSSDKLNSGLGIGLVLVKKLLDLHGGTIVAKSDGIGKGSEFTIELPLYLGVPQKAPAPTKQQTHRDMLKSRRVLIVDDNQDAANALAKLFQLLDADTHAVYSSPEVVAAVDRVKPDILIMDIGMPNINGYELAQVLRKKGFSKTMVALTGYGQSNDKKKSKDSGFDYHLTKPARLEDFTEIFNGPLKD
jgi:PAS domain S-box-containing protein